MLALSQGLSCTDQKAFMHEAKNHSCINITLLNNSRTAWPRILKFFANI